MTERFHLQLNQYYSYLIYHTGPPVTIVTPKRRNLPCPEALTPETPSTHVPQTPPYPRVGIGIGIGISCEIRITIRIRIRIEIGIGIRIRIRIRIEFRIGIRIEIRIRFEIGIGIRIRIGIVSLMCKLIKTVLPVGLCSLPSGVMLE